jgi:hypothetical protein
MRHRDPKLTSGVYTDIRISNLRNAVESILPTDAGHTKDTQGRQSAMNMANTTATVLAHKNKNPSGSRFTVYSFVVKLKANCIVLLVFFRRI